MSTRSLGYQSTQHEVADQSVMLLINNSRLSKLIVNSKLGKMTNR